MWKFLSLLAFAAVIVCVFSNNLCRLREPCSVSYKTLGCYADNVNDRALPNYIYNERDATVSNYGNRKIEWLNWNNYIVEFSCRCAQRAKVLGYDLFAVQFYGECWAGHKSQHNYAKHGTSDECITDNYKPCYSLQRYCDGKAHTNFVYEIVEFTCDLEFERVGCFNDHHVAGERPLGDYILSDRDIFAPSFSGQTVDWMNYDLYLPEFACRCAKKANASGNTYFGLQFYGECWSHAQGKATFARDGASPKCKDRCFQPCGGAFGEICVGDNNKNYVYRLKRAGQPSCDVQLESVGCYTEDPKDRALDFELRNTVPGSDKFCGQMPVIGKWDDFFPDFLCTCARTARGKGWKYFGVSDYGACYSGNNAQNYTKHGDSQACREGDANKTCAAGSKMCSGSSKTSNYIYKIVTSSEKRSYQPPYVQLLSDPDKNNLYDFEF